VSRKYPRKGGKQAQQQHGDEEEGEGEGEGRGKRLKKRKQLVSGPFLILSLRASN
jgi:hypothetical protein